MDTTPRRVNDPRMEHLQSQDPGEPTSTRRALLTASAAGVVAAPLIATAASSAPETDTSDDGGPGRPLTPQPPDRELRDLMREVDPRRIEAIINKLVSFGTRHTLSSQDDPVRGIGAARDWLYAQFQQIAATSGGR